MRDNHAIYYQQPSQSGPFGIQIASDGTAWVSNSGGLRPRGQGSIARYALRNGQWQQIFLLRTGDTPTNDWCWIRRAMRGWLRVGTIMVYRVKDEGTMYRSYVDTSKLWTGAA